MELARSPNTTSQKKPTHPGRAKGQKQSAAVDPLASFYEQRTIAISELPDRPGWAEGATVVNQVGLSDFHKSQAVMLFSSAFLGLLIGLCIALLL